MALVRSTTTFHAPGPVTVAEGAILDDGDPIVKQYRSFFEPINATARRDSQLLADATARPGAKRVSRAEG